MYFVTSYHTTQILNTILLKYDQHAESKYKKFRIKLFYFVWRQEAYGHQKRVVTHPQFPHHAVK